MLILANKKVIIIGDRDGIPGPAIAACAISAGASVIFTTTECFVWTAAGSMDLQNQARIKELTAEIGAENIVVLLGAAEPDTASIIAETVTLGDPTFAGSLAGVPLGLKVYHIIEPEIKIEIDPAVYEEQVAMMEMVVDVDALAAEVSKMRQDGSRF